MSRDTISNAIIGHEEMTIYTKLGVPSRTLSSSSQGKIWIYEYYGEGMRLVPHRAGLSLTQTLTLVEKNRGSGFFFRSPDYRITSETEPKEYHMNVSYFKVFIDDRGICIGFDHNLSKTQINNFIERIKKSDSK